MSDKQVVYVDLSSSNFGICSPYCHCHENTEERMKKENYYQCKDCKAKHFYYCLESPEVDDEFDDLIEIDRCLACEMRAREAKQA